MLLASDLSLNLLLLATSRYALNNFSSLEALSWAFVLPNFVYLVFAVEYACMKNRIMLRRQIWPYLLAGILPLLYLALSPPWPQSVWSDVASWLCMGIAIIVSGVAMLAFRRVVL